MKPHTIAVDDYIDYEAQARIVGSHGAGNSKSLEMYTHPRTGHVRYEIINFREIVVETTNFVHAVEEYNKI